MMVVSKKVLSLKRFSISKREVFNGVDSSVTTEFVAGYTEVELINITF